MALVTKKATANRARGHQTQWAAQFAVASELCKRGYEVAFTSGHTTPLADLMVVSPITKTMFLVDVKGLYRKNAWIIKQKQQRPDLYYVLAYVPENETNHFFVLAQQDATKLIQSALRRRNLPETYQVTGFPFSLAEKYKEKWDVLPK